MLLRAAPPKRLAEVDASEADPSWPDADDDAEERDVADLAQRLEPMHARSARPRRWNGQGLLFAGVSLLALLGTAAVAVLAKEWAKTLQPGAARALSAQAETSAAESKRWVPSQPAEPPTQLASRPARSAADFAAAFDASRAQMPARAESTPQRTTDPSTSTVSPPAEARPAILNASAGTHTDASAPALASISAVADRPAAPARPSAPRLPAAEIAALLERAHSLTGIGDVAGARHLAELAATDGDADALFILAETFDPARLKQWRVRGVKADPDRARVLYQQAADHGNAAARARLATRP